MSAPWATSHPSGFGVPGEMHTEQIKTNTQMHMKTFQKLQNMHKLFTMSSLEKPMKKMHVETGKKIARDRNPVQQNVYQDSNNQQN